MNVAKISRPSLAVVRENVVDLRPRALQSVPLPIAQERAAIGEWTRWACAFVWSRMSDSSSAPEKKLRPTPEFVTAHVAAIAKIPSAELCGHGRERATLEARFAAYYLCRTMTRASSLHIGRLLGRDHSSVLNGVRSAERLMAEDSAYARRVEAMREMITESFRITGARRANQTKCPLCKQSLHEKE